MLPPGQRFLGLLLAAILALLAGGLNTARGRESPKEDSAAPDYPEPIDDDSELMDEFTFLEEESMVESAARHVQEIGMSPSAITVLTRKDIEASGARTVPDLLRLVPGMDVMVMSPFFTALTARLYLNNENNHFLVLIDGREANIELQGQPPWEIQPIMLEDIERIEIIRGPGSSLYGANALAGVISITTRSVPEATSGWARLAGGEPGALSIGARGSTTIGDWGFSLGAEGDFSGGFDDFRLLAKEVRKIRALAEYRWSEQRNLMLEAAFSRSTGSFASSLGFIEGTYNLGTMRASYRSEDIGGTLYWMWSPICANLAGALEYGGIRLARFAPADIDIHTVNAEAQWTLPELHRMLLLIVGGGGRFSFLSSNQLLDAKTYPDINSRGYHQPGAEHWEMRASTFAHGELTPTDWLTVTGGVRLDYNTETNLFISPRLAAVFRPWPGQFVRLGVARSFRKPAYFEAGIHLMAVFPDDSPITGPAQEKFQEFLTRVGANSNLGNEELLSFEAGYLGQFLDGTLSMSLDLYYNWHTRVILMDAQIVTDPSTGLPDLDLSSFMFDHIAPNLSIIGSELSIRYSPSAHLSLLASWTHREVFAHESEGQVCDRTTPKNLMVLGGRLSTPSGLLSSLYLFSRSEYLDVNVTNPAGLLEPLLHMQMDNVLLLLGKFGWRLETGLGLKMETGLKLFLPISPSQAPHFRFYEKGGGISPNQIRYGGQQLSRALTAYLQGSF